MYFDEPFAAARSMDTKDMATISKGRKKKGITLKVQSSSWKKVREMQIDPNEPLRVLYAMCAEELKRSVGSIKLTYVYCISRKLYHCHINS